VLIWFKFIWFLRS
jgi:hypothetical protein